MHFPEMTPTIATVADKQRNDILRDNPPPKGLRLQGLKEGEIKLGILMELSKAGQTNVYKLWKRLHDSGHYSTVLRALRVLKFFNLVRVVPSNGTGRNTKVYTITRFGELILALVKGGWRLVAQLLAKVSPSFRKCIIVHFPHDPYYYWKLARDVIREYVKAGWEHALEDIDIDSLLNIEEIVKRIEIDWIKTHIVEEIDNPSSRPWISKYIKRTSDIPWIKSELLPFIDDYIEEQKEWLQVLNGFRSDMLSAEKCVKLGHFVSGKKEENT
jgi:DNA-binding PadR family transcriptional regulator